MSIQISRRGYGLGCGVECGTAKYLGAAGCSPLTKRSPGCRRWCPQPKHHSSPNAQPMGLARMLQCPVQNRHARPHPAKGSQCRPSHLQTRNGWRPSSPAFFPRSSPQRWSLPPEISPPRVVVHNRSGQLTQRTTPHVARLHRQCRRPLWGAPCRCVLRPLYAEWSPQKVKKHNITHTAHSGTCFST